MTAKLPLPPGPKISLLRLATFRELRADPLDTLTRLTRKFGDICTFKTVGQRYVLLNHPDLVKEVLLTQADAFWKGPALQNSKGLLGNGLLTAEGDTHRTHRRLLTPAFHARHVESYTPDIVNATHDMLGEWRTAAAGGTAPFTSDIRPHTMGLTLVIAAKTLFGTAVSKQEIATVHRCMDDLMNGYMRAVVPWGWILNHLPLKSTRKLENARRELHALINRIISERRARPTHANDLLSQMLAATDTGEEPSKGCPMHAGGSVKTPVRLTDEQLRDHAITILTAGHETTANALAFTLYLLARHPGEQEKIRAEAASVLEGRNPAPQVLDRLPLTHHVLAESMRLLPPAWTVARQNQRELVLNGYRIPRKSTILIPQWTLHRDPRFWPEPDEFRPDRWFHPDHPRYAYNPFSTGPRNCIGEAFAWLEMLLVLPMLVSRFRFSLPPDALPMELTPAITLRPKHAVPLIITPL